jgi:hypothetical protein
MDTKVVLELLEDWRVTHHLDQRSTVSPPRAGDESDLERALSEMVSAAGGTRTTSLKSTEHEVFKRFGPGSRVRGNPDIQAVTEYLSTISISLASLGGGAAFLEIARDVLIQWLKNRESRSITLKCAPLPFRFAAVTTLSRR